MDIVEDGCLLRVDGNAFKKLSPNDRKSLLSRVKASRRITVKENLKEGGITGQEYVNEMDAFDQSVFGDTEFFSFLQSAEGRAEVIALACEKANPDLAKAASILDGLSLDLNEDFLLAVKLSGVKLRASDEEAEPPEPRPSEAGS